MTSSPAPQPCPFTLSSHRIEMPLRMMSTGSSFFLSCPACECRGPLAATRELAIMAWNERSHAPAAATEAAESLARELERLWNDGSGLPTLEWAAIHRAQLESLAARIRLLAHPPGAGLAEPLI